jgi:hypothetical protein
VKSAGIITLAGTVGRHMVRRERRERGSRMRGPAVDGLLLIYRPVGTA